nr:nadph:adrenodoxin oxidoreductase, mitochondrial [Quercus suber]
MPTPFGLVWSGVAPDHPETKVARHDRCSVFGNVTLGSSVFLLELRELYHVVVLAYGAESDRVLGIPGERICLVVNGHPDCKNLDLDLENTDTAVILGQGNVALDVACIFLQPATELAAIDIVSHALAALEKSSIRKMYLVRRSGTVQATCTAKELHEALGKS